MFAAIRIPYPRRWAASKCCSFKDLRGRLVLAKSMGQGRGCPVALDRAALSMEYLRWPEFVQEGSDSLHKARTYM